METAVELMSYLKLGSLVTLKYLLYAGCIYSKLYNLQSTNNLMYSLKLEKDEKARFND